MPRVLVLAENWVLAHTYACQVADSEMASGLCPLREFLVLQTACRALDAMLCVVLLAVAVLVLAVAVLAQSWMALACCWLDLHCQWPFPPFFLH